MQKQYQIAKYNKYDEQDNSLSSIVLFNVRVNILTEFWGVFKYAIVRLPKLNSTPSIYRHKNPIKNRCMIVRFLISASNHVL